MRRGRPPQPNKPAWAHSWDQKGKTYLKKSVRLAVFPVNWTSEFNTIDKVMAVVFDSILHKHRSAKVCFATLLIWKQCQQNTTSISYGTAASLYHNAEAIAYECTPLLLPELQHSCTPLLLPELQHSCKLKALTTQTSLQEANIF